MPELIKTINYLESVLNSEALVIGIIRDELLEKTDNIIYLDFDDRAVTRQIQKWEDIVDRVKDKRKKDSVMFCLMKYRKLTDGIMHAVLYEEKTALFL